MIYDPKIIIGDVIASLYSQPANEDELLLRFDNHENGMLHSALLGTLKPGWCEPEDEGKELLVIKIGERYK